MFERERWLNGVISVRGLGYELKKNLVACYAQKNPAQAARGLLTAEGWPDAKITALERQVASYNPPQTFPPRVS